MRQQSKILTASEQKTADTLATLKDQFKTETGIYKDLNKTATIATKAATKQLVVVTKLAARIAKLTPAKPVIVAATGTGVAQAA